MDTPSQPTFSVMVMAWNEINHLEEVVFDLTNELTRLGKPFEIIIIDDGSTDGTAAVADRLATELIHLRVIHHPYNQGLGAVYRTGFEEARGEWLSFFPADGQFSAKILGDYAAYMDNADLILGFLEHRERPFLGRLLSWSERILLRMLFGHFPRFQGILLFRRQLLLQHHLVSEGRGWIILMELILRSIRQGARYQCVPISLRPRRSGRSKVNNLKSIGSNLGQLAALRFRL